MAGLLALARLNVQFFPDLDTPTIVVEVAWPGASAADIEDNILNALEPELQNLEGLKTSLGIARSGRAFINLEFHTTTDMKEALSAVEQVVSRVTTLPATSERPKIKRKTYYDHVATISISGDLPEQSLKVYAKKIRDGLRASGISQIALTGIRDEEISVRVKEADLQRLELSIASLSRHIEASVAASPSGNVEGRVRRQIRLLSNRKSAKAIGETEIKSLDTGQKIYLKDVSDVFPSFDRDGEIGLSRGKPAIRLEIKRAHSEDALEIKSKLESYLAATRAELPEGVRLDVYDVRAKFISQTLHVLLMNGLYGLCLVLMTLFVFLHWRISICVAIGMPLALLASLAVMFVTGQSINMISMLALIMMLGMIVDDAIIVGEHSSSLFSRGSSPVEAADRGVHGMLSPVIVASLTTMVAFLPALFVTGPVGVMLSVIPLVVCTVLIASLCESFVILPEHLRRAFSGGVERGKFGRAFDNQFDRFRSGAYQSFLKTSYRWRYTVIAFAIAALALSVAMLASGRVGFTFFASPEAENIFARVVFSAGTPRDAKIRALTRIEQALYRVEALVLESELEAKHDKRRLVQSTFITIGEISGTEDRNTARIDVQLTPNEDRGIRTKDLIDTWRQSLPKLAGTESLTIQQRRSGPPGQDLDIRLTGGTLDALKSAAVDLKEALAQVPGVSAISDDTPWGEPELILNLTPRGTALGFTSESVGRQVRNAFEGAIAARLVRGDEEVAIRVLRAQNLPGIAGLLALHLLSPNGHRVPIGEVVQIRERSGFSTIRHTDGIRTISVTGTVDHQRTSMPQVLEQLSRDVSPGLVDKYGVDYEYSGRAKERENSFKDLRMATLLSFAVIFAILAWSFESYVKPLLVMAIIPFGFIGVVVGHWLLGFNFTIITIVGFLGLSGVMINNSIILLTEMGRYRENGLALSDATMRASRDRLRAVILTTLTTVVGLLPLLLESNRNAQFLIPLAITFVFGLAVATVLVLVLLPALVGVCEDVRSFGTAQRSATSQAPLTKS